MINYYDVLNISKKASCIDIENAYKIQINLHKNNKIKIRKIKKAYSILGDFNNRKKYDKYLKKKISINQVINLFGRRPGAFDGLAISFTNYLLQPKFNLKKKEIELITFKIY